MTTYKDAGVDIDLANKHTLNFLEELNNGL